MVQPGLKRRTSIASTTTAVSWRNMDQVQYNLFRKSKRVSLREEDMTVLKLSRIFQVSVDSLYLTDDANVAIFASDSSGMFSSLDLCPRGHYEVHGEDDVAAPGSSTGQRFAFSRTSTVTSGSLLGAAALPRASNKTFQRSVYLAEALSGKLSVSRMVMVRFSEAEASPQGIAAKVKEAIGSPENLILTDSQGNAIVESEGTTGSPYWRQNARKVLAVPEKDFTDLQGTKRRRMSRKNEEVGGIAEVTEKIEELVLASQSLPDVTSAFRELTDLAAVKRLTLTQSQLQAIKHGFSCAICLKLMTEPIFTQCCQTLIGCKTCVEEWHRNSDTCAKCRGSVEGDSMFEVKGLSEALSVLRSLFEEE
ncbi:uncharacterized protein LOC134092282 [Sardina pilchardus]|uniref:uncharacterized protein LOC134092282 n=1 Tax=Sardina pilchardus TaxID=27697 RepID=UPI002E118361